MVRVVARLLSGYCLHLPDVFTGTHKCISSLRPHPVVAGVGVDLASIQFSCSVATAIFVLLLLGECCFQAAGDGWWGWFPGSVCGFFGAQGFDAVPGCCVEGVLPESVLL